jgi:hypothetical protein
MSADSIVYGLVALGAPKISGFPKMPRSRAFCYPAGMADKEEDDAPESREPASEKPEGEAKKVEPKKVEPKKAEPKKEEEKKEEEKKSDPPAKAKAEGETKPVSKSVEWAIAIAMMVILVGFLFMMIHLMRSARSAVM